MDDFLGIMKRILKSPSSIPHFLHKNENVRRMIEVVNDGRRSVERLALSEAELDVEKVKEIPYEQLSTFLVEKNSSDNHRLSVVYVNAGRRYHASSVAVLKESVSRGGRNIFLALESLGYGAYDSNTGCYDESITDEQKKMSNPHSICRRLSVQTKKTPPSLWYARCDWSAIR